MPDDSSGRVQAFLKGAPGAFARRAELAPTLDRLWEHARAAWPSVKWTPAAFAEHLGDSARRGRLSPGDLEQLAVSDLYLCGACLAGSAEAIECFERAFFPPLDADIARVRPGRDFLEDARQELRITLFGPRSKLSNYAGRAPLRAWLRPVALRTALNIWRSETRAGLRSSSSAAALQVPGNDLELTALQSQGKELFGLALREGVSALPRRERTLLRLHFVHGMSLSQLGRVYGVDKSTVGRWLARCRAQLLRSVKTDLKRRLKAETPDVSSLLRAMSGQLSGSLETLLATTPS